MRRPPFSGLTSCLGDQGPAALDLGPVVRPNDCLGKEGYLSLGMRALLQIRAPVNRTAGYWACLLIFVAGSPSTAAANMAGSRSSTQAIDSGD